MNSVVCTGSMLKFTRRRRSRQQRTCNLWAAGPSIHYNVRLIQALASGSSVVAR